MPLAAGACLGPYRIETLIGAGGMGEVYRAKDSRLDRSVAIKVLPAPLTTNPEVRRRFEREARAASQLSHPNICMLHDVGRQDDVDYVVMELLHGETLGTRLKSGPLELGQALEHTLAILSALEALHAGGLVHRDLKPSNLFLTAHGIKVLDFGVARAVEGNDDQENETRTSAVLGTPHYMAPEAIRGAPVDARADLFALGVILFEMLTGKRPFRGQTTAEVMHAITHDRPPVLTGGAAVTAVDRVLHHAMARAREQRYETAADMAREVRDLLPLASDVPAGTVARPMTRLIVLPFRLLRPDADIEFLSFSLSDAVTASLSDLESLIVRSSMAASKFAGEAIDLPALAEQASVDVALMGTLLRSGDTIRATAQLIEVPAGTVLWNHRAQVALGDLFQLQDELARRIVESLSIPLSSRDTERMSQDLPKSATAYEYYLRANQLNYRMRDWEVARQLYERCLERDPEYAPALARLGGIYRNIAKWIGDDPADNHARAEAALQKALALNDQLGVAHKIYAYLDADRGRARQAMLRLLERVGVSRSDPELYAGLVIACRVCGLLEASAAAGERARRLDPQIRTSLHHTLFMLGRYEEAMATDDHQSHLVRAYSLQMLGRAEEAANVLRRVESKLQRGDGSSLLDLVRASRARAERDHDGFLRVLRPVMHVFPDVEAVFYLARCCAQFGDLDLAIELLAQSNARGFHCYPVFTDDPWLDPLRSAPAFSRLLDKVKAEHRESLGAFLEAGGDRRLGLSVRA